LSHPEKLSPESTGLETELDRLRRRESLLKAAERIANIGHWEWDYLKNRLISCSEGFARIYNLSVAKILESQNTWENMLVQIHPDDRDRFISVYKSQPETSEHEIEYRIVLDDGQIRYVKESGIVQFDNDNRAVSAFGLLQDITDRVVYEQELENRDALASQVEAITDIGHYIFNLQEENYHYVSEGFARIHGVSPEEYTSMISSRQDDVEDVHPEDCSRLAAVYDQHASEGEDFNVEYRIFRADGEIRWILEQGTAIRNKEQIIVQSVGVVQDITEQKNTEQKLRESRDSLETIVKNRTRKLVNTVKRLEAEVGEREKIAAELDFLANHDALTGLPSLRLCKDRLEHSLAEARRSRQQSAVMFLDLDGFKEINDTHSHEFGDLVLKATADRITAVIRETDTVARIGGDEFIIILSSVPDLKIVKRIATNLIEQIASSIQIEQYRVAVTGSIGIAMYPDNGTTSEELIRAADRAMYRIKESGKNSYGFVLAEQEILKSS
jgi:diguanylate cyclase (GGDEF)-like protein/PAS domain S-box-containing protein